MKLSRRHFMATAAAAASIAPAILSTSRSAQAAAPVVGKAAPSFYRFKVGDFEVTTLHDGLIKIPNPAAMITNKTPDEINQALDIAMIPRDNMFNPFVPTIVNTGKNLVLIDTGFGDNGPPTVGQLANNMTAAGINPKDIDTILITHFHGDHISGLRTKAGDAVYPGAEIMVGSVEWKYWNDESELGKVTDPFKPTFAATKRVFTPNAKDIKQIEFGKEVVPGITAIDTRGHSLGHTSYLIASGNSSLLVLGDVTNNPAIFARNPEWRLWADQFPDVALASRRRLLDMAAADKIPVIGYHYWFPAVGRFTKTATGYEYFPAMWQTAL